MTVTEFIPNDHISKRSLSRYVSHFTSKKELPEGFVAHPKPIYFQAGAPNPIFYPVNKITLQISEGPDVPYGKKEDIAQPVFLSKDVKQKNDTVVDPTPIKTEREIVDPALLVDVNKFKTPGEKALVIAEAFQYGGTVGAPSFLNFITDFISRVNPPAFDNWKVHLSHGAGDGIHKAFDLLVNPGDTVLTEELTFSPVFHMIRDSGGVPYPTPMDFDEGIIPEALDDLLTNWGSNPDQSDLKKPKVLYTIPTGQNPTGLTQSLERRKKIYAIAEKHDLVILEDDPYGYLVHPKFVKGSPPTPTTDVEKFLKEELSPSYLTLDTKGRVIRLETFSKVFAPGLRVGFLVAHEDFIKRIGIHSMITSKGVSGASQAILENIIRKHWGGFEGWIKWILKVKTTYNRRAYTFLNSLYSSEAYKKGFYTVVEPAAGMFGGIRINLDQLIPKDTPKDEIDYRDLLDEYNAYCAVTGVDVVLGNKMASSPRVSKLTNFIRLTYAFVDNDEQIVEGCNRVAEAVTLLFKAHGK